MESIESTAQLSTGKGVRQALGAQKAALAWIKRSITGDPPHGQVEAEFPHLLGQ